MLNSAATKMCELIVQLEMYLEVISLEQLGLETEEIIGALEVMIDNQDEKYSQYFIRESN